MKRKPLEEKEAVEFLTRSEYEYAYIIKETMKIPKNITELLLLKNEFDKLISKAEERKCSAILEEKKQISQAALKLKKELLNLTKEEVIAKYGNTKKGKNHNYD